MAAKRTISLRVGIPHIDETAKAAVALTPGHHLAYDTNGDLVKHATSGGYGARMVAMERDEMGDDIDDNYAVGDTVKVGLFRQGDKVLMLMPSGQSFKRGDILMSDGAGRVTARTSTNIGLWMADETIAATADTRVKVVVI